MSVSVPRLLVRRYVNEVASGCIIKLPVPSIASKPEPDWFEFARRIESEVIVTLPE